MSMAYVMGKEQEEVLPYRIMRLNRAPAVGPVARKEDSESTHSSCGYESSPATLESERQYQIEGEGQECASCTACSGKVYLRDKITDDIVPVMATTTKPSVMTTSPPAHRLRRGRGQAIVRAATDHLKGGGVLVEDAPELIYAGRRAPRGYCAAAAQHVQLFATPTSPSETPADIFWAKVKSSRQSRLAMLRGSGPLW
ncbi:hypothetical protein DPX39_050016300 [Trypanosoma brucei equiperdum]|uniref:Uncharacterized protein n=1 Tax=Trypanosoma brucei equiperdum TaxID=630700 RepID=A0A3L6L8H7_9TRYP|nr:hypothetical protein DPX39_050016300 [Trypanosoma brucei equiperdum]